MKRRSAFTLVELLVVIGIIALLISILLPALQKVQQQAKLLQCLTICRNMAQAAHIHANDHKGFMPVAGLLHSPTGGVANPTGLDDASQKKYTYYSEGAVRRPAPLMLALAQYMGIKVKLNDRQSVDLDLKSDAVRKMFKCPAHELTIWGHTIEGGDGWPGALMQEYMSYIFNEEFLGKRELGKDGTVHDTTGHSTTPRGNTAQVKRPGQVFLFGDGLPRELRDGGWLTAPASDIPGRLNVPLNDTTMYHYYLTYQADWKNFDLKRHGGKMNIVFVDCHAETITLPGGLREVGLTRGIYNAAR